MTLCTLFFTEGGGAGVGGVSKSGFLNLKTFLYSGVWTYIESTKISFWIFHFFFHFESKESDVKHSFTLGLLSQKHTFSTREVGVWAQNICKEKWNKWPLIFKNLPQLIQVHVKCLESSYLLFGLCSTQLKLN